MNTTNQPAAPAAQATKTALAPSAVPNPGNPNPVINKIELTGEEIAKDIVAINALIAKWKASALTGQLSIAIGGLHRAVEYAQYHAALLPKK
ncbi:MAG: hypothetical protein ABSE16_18405 [Verrucomicrobiota bacterium]|jgi:hypothetical protein